MSSELKNSVDFAAPEFGVPCVVDSPDWYHFSQMVRDAFGEINVSDHVLERRSTARIVYVRRLTATLNIFQFGNANGLMRNWKTASRSSRSARSNCHGEL